MKLVLLESPFKGAVDRNKEYALMCMRDCFKRGEAPFASHLLYTLCLDDSLPEERALGIAAGLLWGEKASKTVVYIDYGISSGMQYGIETAIKINRPIEYRNIL